MDCLLYSHNKSFLEHVFVIWVALWMLDAYKCFPDPFVCLITSDIYTNHPQELSKELESDISQSISLFDD